MDGRSAGGPRRLTPCTSRVPDSNSVVQMAESVFVLISRMLGFVLRVLLSKSCSIPALHCDLGVVRRGQSFLRANGSYPLIDRFLIGLL